MAKRCSIRPKLLCAAYDVDATSLYAIPVTTLYESVSIVLVSAFI